MPDIDGPGINGIDHAAEAVVDLKAMASVIRSTWSKVAKTRLLNTIGNGPAAGENDGTPFGFIKITLGSIIAGTVERLDDLESVQIALADLRRLQAQHGCGILDIAAGRVALLSALQQVLGAQYTAEIELAWMQLYDFIAAALDVSASSGQANNLGADRRSA